MTSTSDTTSRLLGTHTSDTYYSAIASSGKGKRAAPKDGARRKSIPRLVKIKPKNPPNDIRVKTPQPKAANGKPIAGRSPEEIEQALRHSSLPEEHILEIFPLPKPFPP